MRGRAQGAVVPREPGLAAGAGARGRARRAGRRAQRGEPGAAGDRAGPAAQLLPPPHAGTPPPPRAKLLTVSRVEDKDTEKRAVSSMADTCGVGIMQEAPLSSVGIFGFR
jgi:hypothetical protein